MANLLPMSLFTTTSEDGIDVKTKAMEESRKNYDPHLHRNIKEPTTYWVTVVHLLKGALGTGILAMPQAFKHSGWVMGWILTMCIGLFLVYCLHTIIRNQYILCKKEQVPYISYPDAMEKSFLLGPDCFKYLAPIAGYTVDLFLFLYQLGICGAYVVFVSTTAHQIIDKMVDDNIDVRFYMLIIVVPLLFFNLIPNLKKLAPLSIGANILIFISLSMIFSFYVFTDLPPISERNAFGKVLDLPLFVGTCLFSIESVGLILAVEQNCKDPKQFVKIGGSLDQAMIILSILYAMIGFFGYYKYGEKILGSITMNIYDGSMLARYINITYAVAILFSYPLQCYVPVEIVWGKYVSKHFDDAKPNTKFGYEVLTRSMLVILSLIFALAVPNLGLYISLLGALCLSTLGITFAGCLEFCVAYDGNNRKWCGLMYLDILIIVIGLSALVLGTYSCIRDITEAMQQ